mgnify:CR=1 FL=1
MTATMTIFCHGTKSYSDEVALNPTNGREYGEEEQELVWVLEKYYRMPENLQSETFNGGKLLLHGVGSVNDPTANRVILSDGGLQGGPSNMPVIRLLNMACGNGISRNISKAITFLEYMADHGRKPSCINLAGWSRGGVTCVRLAQALHANAKLRDIEVNIFAGDPVPGAGRHNTWTLSKNYTIPSNVRRYLQVMAMHVDGLKGRLFKPLHPVVANTTRTVAGVLPMPGDHSQVVKAGMVRAGTASPGAITVDMAIRFLRLCGSEGVEAQGLKAFELPAQQIYDYYQQIHASVQSDDGTYGTPKVPGLFNAARSMVRYTRKTDANALNLAYMKIGYVNDHHHLLAQRFGGAGGGPSMEPRFKTMLKTMYA